jgi:hypothetical protein
MQNLITARPGLLADVNDNDRTPRQTMVDAADSYFESIEHGKGSIAPFAEDCERNENGGQTTHNKTPVPWPVDLGSPTANQDMAVISFPMFQHRGGKIHEIEATGVSLPYGDQKPRGINSRMG